MNREEYFMCLDGYLRKLTDEERKEAIQFYQDYFDEAGPENEQSVIDSLGSPKELAKSILDGERNGEFTENGYQKTGVNNELEIVTDTNEAEAKTEDDGNWKVVIGVIIIVVAAPLLISLASSILGLIVGFAAASIALVISGIVLLFTSFPTMFGSLGIGVMLLGISFVLVALGILFALLVDFICRGVIPFCIKLIKKFGTEFFGNK